MAEQQKSSYTSEEAEEILTRAARKQTHGQVSHDRLLAMADELGITPAEVEAAIAETAARREEAALRDEFVAGRRAEFWPHLISFVSVMALLIVLNLATNPHHLWFFYPLLGWGVGMVGHAAHALPTKGDTFDKEFAEWKRKKAQREQRKSRRASKKSAANASVTSDAPAAAKATASDTTAVASAETFVAPASPPGVTQQPSEEAQQIRVGGRG